MEQDEKNKNTTDGTPVENTGDQTQEQDNARPAAETDNNIDSHLDSCSPDSASLNDTQVFKVTLPQDENEALVPDGDQELSPAVEEGKKGGKPKKKKSVLRSVIYSSSIVVISFLLAFLLLYCFTDYMGMFRGDKTANITITSSTTTGQLATMLKDNGIIRSKTVFNIFITLSKKNEMKSGVYSINSNMSYAAIMKRVKNAANRSTVKVTIPEGFTLSTVGALLEEDKVCSRKDFLEACKSSTVSFDFQSQIPNDKNRFYRLEGYIFPDTYEFYLGQSADSVVKKMLTNFDKRLDSGLRAKIKASGMTVDQIVTLASIIQVEAGKTSEMSMVSSVFHNRLEKGVDGVKMLQSDATIFYGTNVIEPATQKGSAQAAAYNTYKITGLTPGPICNPGLAAIRAAITPDKTNDFFFVSDKNGDYYYAQTYAKHLKNVKKALSTGKADGTNVTKK